MKRNHIFVVASFKFHDPSQLIKNIGREKRIHSRNLGFLGSGFTRAGGLLAGFRPRPQDFWARIGSFRDFLLGTGILIPMNKITSSYIAVHYIFLNF